MAQQNGDALMNIGFIPSPKNNFGTLHKNRGVAFGNNLWYNKDSKRSPQTNNKKKEVMKNGKTEDGNAHF